MKIDGSRCTGHCCRRFFLPLTPDDLVQRAAWAKAERETGKHPDPIPDGYQILQDIEQVADMAELVAWVDDDDGNPSPRYRCKHLVDDSCSIYDARPRMCRDYPYSRSCTFEGCTWAMARPLSSHAELLIELGGPIEPEHLVKAVETIDVETIPDDPEEAAA